MRRAALAVFLAAQLAAAEYPIPAERPLLSLGEWLWSTEWPVLPRTVAGVLTVSGGNCTNLDPGRISAADVTTEADKPHVAFRALGASIRCSVLVHDGSIIAQFNVHEANVELGVQGSPWDLAGTSLPPVPLGAVSVTHCKMSAALSNLTFSGGFIAQELLDEMRGLIEHTVNTELSNGAACMEMSPMLESVLSVAASNAAAHLEGLLALPGPLPEPAAAAPLVDWAAYPPLRVAEELLQGRADAIAQIVRRCLPLVRALGAAASFERNGTQITMALDSMRLEGLDTLMVHNTSLGGAGRMVGFASALQRLAIGVVAVVDVDQPGSSGILRRELNVSMSVGDAAVSAQAMAMVSEPELGAMSIDQLQDPACQAACARGAAELPRAPLALQQLWTDGQPELHSLVAPGAPLLDADLAHALETAAAAVLRGYTPALHALVGASAAKLLDDAVVNEALDSVPPCPASQTYRGPPREVEIALLWGSIGLGCVGLVLSLALGPLCLHRRVDPGGSVASPPDSRSLGEDLDGSAWLPRPGRGDCALCRHAAVPPWLALYFPVGALATFGLFVYSIFGLGTVVNLVFEADGQTTVFGPAFAFALLTIVMDSWAAGAYGLSILVGFLSGVWPLVKLVLLVAAWLLPTSAMKPKTRGSLLLFLDQYGKMSLIDSWLAVVALCTYNINWKGGGVSMKVEAVPMMPLFMFVAATVLSLVFGHIATEFHHRYLEWGYGIPGSPRLSRHNLYCTVESAYRGLVLLAVFATGGLVIGGSLIVSFQTTFSGAAADLLVQPEEQVTRFSLLSAAAFLTQAPDDPSLGVYGIQAIFILFTFIIPLGLVGAVVALLLLPLHTHHHEYLLKFCKVLDAWQAFDVFVLAVMVAALDLEHVAHFLVYYDNLGDICGFIRDQFQTECFQVGLSLEPGFALLAVAGLAACVVPKVALRFCQRALDHPKASVWSMRRNVSPGGSSWVTMSGAESADEDLIFDEMTPCGQESLSNISFVTQSSGSTSTEEDYLKAGTLIRALMPPSRS